MFISTKNISKKDISTNATVFFKGQISHIEKVCNLLTTANKIPDCLLSSNFLIVYETVDSFYLVADIVRSYPLFYTTLNNQIFIADNIYHILENIGKYSYDSVAKQEFLLSGFVSGNETLVKNIKQIQAGELVKINKKDLSVTSTYYHQIDYSTIVNKTEDEYTKTLDILHSEVFRKLIDKNKDKTFIVPLSGGYDSRLIIWMFAMFDVKNVICYTYGKKNNKESRISKKIAAHYNYEWIFIEYSKNNISEFSRSNEYEQYIKFGSQLSAIAHIQDLYAIKHLKTQRLIPDNSVFVPGHSYDFLTGSHIDATFVNKKSVTKNECLNYLINKHYSHWNIKNKRNIKNKLQNTIVYKLPNSVSSIAALQIFDNFNLRERQAKYIINSIRAYEFYGYKWALPLWDIKLIRFWQQVPLQLRFNRNYFIKYFSTKLNIRIKTTHTHDTEYKKVLKILNYLNFIKIMARKLKRIFETHKDGLGLYYYFSRYYIYSQILKSTFLSAVSLLIRKYLNNINNDKL